MFHSLFVFTSIDLIKHLIINYKQMATNCEEYVLDESMTDVVFVIDGHRIPAIKVVLSLKSPVFKAMFSGYFRESNIKVIPIKDMDFEAFEAVIKYIHFGVIDLNRFNIDSTNGYSKTFELLKCVDKYQLNGLKDRIEKDLILRKVNISNSKVMLELSDMFGLNEVKNKLKQIIEHNLEPFIDGSDEEIKELNAFSDNYIFETLLKNYKKELAHNKSVSNKYNTLKTKLNDFFCGKLTHVSLGTIHLWHKSKSRVTDDNLVKWTQIEMKPLRLFETRTRHNPNT